MRAQRAKREKQTKVGRSRLPARLPVKGKAPTKAELAQWTRQFKALSLKGQNKVLRDNPCLQKAFYDGRAAAGWLLLSPLAAEHSGDSDRGEHTFLTTLKPLRDRLVREYKIGTAAELMLVDALVLSYYQYIRATTALHSYTAYGASCDYEVLVLYAQAQVVRANDLLLRNPEALRQMKAAPFTIKIDQPGQVNVGEKQVNVSGEAATHGAFTRVARGGNGTGSPAALEAAGRDRA